MKAVVARGATLTCEEIEPPPAPGEGQVLVRTLTCGICGTDLHALGHMHDFLAGLQRSGSALATDPDKPVVFGHEFCGEILDHGPGLAGRLKAGTRIVGLPYLTGPHGAEYVGYSNRYPGGFAEQMVLTEKLLFEVPNGLSAELAAMTEPFAVGAHAVARAGVEPPAVICVVGCGPIGLAVIAALKARGLGPVVGLDFSPGRRRFAELLGADEVADPSIEPLQAVWARHGAGKRGPRAVAFECTGRAGAAQAVVDAAPAGGKLVVVSNALESSSIDQVVAFNKELDIAFSLNYTPAEFRATLEDIAEGRIDAARVLTGVVAPEAAPDAFTALKDPERHAKIIVKFD